LVESLVHGVLVRDLWIKTLRGKKQVKIRLQGPVRVGILLQARPLDLSGAPPVDKRPAPGHSFPATKNRNLARMLLG
jgi:hypothetical protein